MFTRRAEWQSENGLRVEFGLGSYMLRDLTDALGSAAQTVKAPGQHGATTYRVTLGQPVINLTGSIHASPGGFDDMLVDLADMEDYLKRAFIPNRFGVLTDHRANGARRIRCRPVEKPVFGRQIQASRTVDIELIADAAQWESAEVTSLDLGRESGGFRFPLVLPSIMGTYYKDGVIKNPTPEPVYPTVDIYTASAYIAVHNQTTGEKIEIARPLGKDQKMTIDTAEARVTVWERDDAGEWRLIGEASRWLTADSRYWALVPGENRVAIRNEIADETVVATVSFREPM